MADICVASHHDSIHALLNDAEFRGLARHDGFLIELRLDYYTDLNTASFHSVLDAFAPNVVVTYRHPQEGGKNATATDAERLQYLQLAAERGVHYIDIESRTPRAKFRKLRSKLILSFHDFKGVPAPDHGLLHLFTSMADNPEVDIVKIAAFPKTVDESLPLLELLHGIEKQKLPAIILAMGEAGFWTRVLGPLFGAPLTYSRGEGAPGTAPGQPTWRDLEEIYRYRQIRPGWPVYGVIGSPIAHSLSPLMHNKGLRERNLDAVYVPFKVEGDPVKFIRDFTPLLDLRGISVTIPHKEAVVSLCDEVDPLVKQLGVANTLVRRGSAESPRWFGTNTDAIAAADSLENIAGSLNGKNVVIIGAGGAARAVAHGIKVRGASISVLNRTPERAAALAKQVGGTVIQPEELIKAGIDVIVNTTPLGMYPNINDAPLTKEQIPPRSIVFDTVYNPLRTRLLKLAAERGCRTLEGAAMFVGQGVRQFELFTGQKAPIEVMERAVIAALKERQARQNA